jgi:hypothetical protein
MPVAKPNPLLATAERTSADGEKEEAGAPSVLLFAHGPSAAAAGSPAASAREARAPPA